MKLRYLAVFRTDNALELCCEKYLEGLGLFTKSTVAEFLSWVSGQVAPQATPRTLNVVEDKGYYIYVYGREQGICGIMVTDEKYGNNNNRPAESLLRKICDEFLTKYTASVIKEATEANSLPLPDLKEYIMKYQNPAEADTIMRLQNELDETTVVLHQTIETMLERGEKIDSLVQKSNELSTTSKMFFTQAKKQNSCCIVM